MDVNLLKEKLGALDPSLNLDGASGNVKHVDVHASFPFICFLCNVVWILIYMCWLIYVVT